MGGKLKRNSSIPFYFRRKEGLMNSNIPINVTVTKKKFFDIRKLWIKHQESFFVIASIVIFSVMVDVVIFGKGSLIVELVMCK
jgi:hypothetical protein